MSDFLSNPKRFLKTLYRNLIFFSTIALSIIIVYIVAQTVYPQILPAWGHLTDNDIRLSGLILVIAPMSLAIITILASLVLNIRGEREEAPQIIEDMYDRYGYDLTLEDVTHILYYKQVTDGQVEFPVLNAWSVGEDDNHSYAPVIILGDTTNGYRMFDVAGKHEVFTEEVQAKLDKIEEFGVELYHDNRGFLYKQLDTGENVLFSEPLRAMLFLGADMVCEEISKNDFWGKWAEGTRFVLNPSGDDDLEQKITLKELHFIFEYSQYEEDE